MAEKRDSFFTVRTQVAQQLHDDTEKTFKARSVPTGMTNLQPHEWKARVDSDPAFAQAEMDKLTKELGPRKGRSEFLKRWR